MSDEYPRCLYRDGDGDGVTFEGPLKTGFDHLIVNGEDEELAALDVGWRRTVEKPADEARRGPGRPPKHVPEQC